MQDFQSPMIINFTPTGMIPKKEMTKHVLVSPGGVGNCQASIHAMATASGTDIRVGAEDNICYNPSRTRLARNIELVKRTHDLAVLCNRSVLSTAATRSKLQLKPGHGEYSCLEER